MLNEADVLALQSHSRCFLARQPARNAGSAGRMQRKPVESHGLRHGDYSGHIKPSSRALGGIRSWGEGKNTGNDNAHGG